MGADGANVVHLPRTRLITIRAGSQRTDRTNVNAHAALFAVEVIALVWRNHRTHAAILNAERPNVHAFSAHAYAAVTEDAAGTIEVNHRRPLLFIFVVLDLDELALGRAVAERHVLQLALSAGVAHRAVERMVAEEHFDHRLACLPDFFAVGGRDHAFADHGCTCGLQLRHLLDFNQAHATCTLQRQAWVVAERGDFDADALAGLDQ